MFLISLQASHKSSKTFLGHVSRETHDCIMQRKLVNNLPFIEINDIYVITTQRVCNYRVIVFLKNFRHDSGKVN